MVCLNEDKFVINKSLDNEFILTIKQQNSTLPMVIENSDTFKAKLFKLSDNSIDMSTEDADPSMVISVYSYNSGKIKLTINNASNLVSDRGSKADRYYLKPTYRLAIECDTVNNGKFVAKVDTVYVDA